MRQRAPVKFRAANALSDGFRKRIGTAHLSLFLSLSLSLSLSSSLCVWVRVCQIASGSRAGTSLSARTAQLFPNDWTQPDLRVLGTFPTWQDRFHLTSHQTGTQLSDVHGARERNDVRSFQELVLEEDARQGSQPDLVR